MGCVGARRLFDHTTFKVTSLESLSVTLYRPVCDLILGYQVGSRTEGPGIEHHFKQGRVLLEGGGHESPPTTSVSKVVKVGG